MELLIILGSIAGVVSAIVAFLNWRRTRLGRAWLIPELVTKAPDRFDRWFVEVRNTGTEVARDVKMCIYAMLTYELDPTSVGDSQLRVFTLHDVITGSGPSAVSPGSTTRFQLDGYISWKHPLILRWRTPQGARRRSAWAGDKGSTGNTFARAPALFRSKAFAERGWRALSSPFTRLRHRRTRES